MTRSFLCLGVTAACLSGCLASDGDLAASPALVGLTLNASTDLLSQRQSLVTGEIELGYTDSRMVDLAILDNGVPVYTTSQEATDLVIPFGATLDLLSVGPNALTAEARYQGQSITTAATVAVPGALGGLSVSAATDVAAAEVVVDAGIDLGFVSDQAVVLLITVDGDVAVSRSLPAASTRLDVQETVILPSAGPNVVQTRVSYQGMVLEDSAVVTVTPPDPMVTAPAWSQALIAGSELRVTGALDVVPPAPWTVSDVRVSDDGGLTWAAATQGVGTAWDLAIVNPEVLGHALLYAVDLTHHGLTQTSLWADTLWVDPIFDCNDPLAMLPTTDLVADHNTEVRTMVGYFGKPDGPHTFSFTIDTTVPGDGRYQVVGAEQSRGAFAIDTEFNTDRLDCGGCALDYDLEVYVDGVLWCAENNYGNIQDYN